MALVEQHQWSNVWSWNECLLPYSLRVINKMNDLAQQIAASAAYYINNYPNPSWTAVAGSLFRYEQTVALEALIPFLPPKGEIDSIPHRQISS